ncbi:MAG: hypothetical protein SFU87_13380 [Chitinophagaceae bacterium]|nr:hypothetical protein [Chitinophagaceae bacterium]
MRNFTFILFLLLHTVTSYSQSATKDEPAARRDDWRPWWTLYISAAGLPSNVYISNGGPGAGSGQTFLFPGKSRVRAAGVPVWLGVDFNHHYFGTANINMYKVHYENWQLSFVMRFTNTTPARIKPFMDVTIGGRYLVSFTTEEKGYAGVLLLRSVDVAIAAFSNGNVNSNADYKIRAEYGKVSMLGSLSGGLMLVDKKTKWGGFTCKGSLQFGTTTRYANRRKLSEDFSNVFYYPLKTGSGIMYTFQLGYTVR